MENIRAVLLMIFAMASFAIGDAFVKMSSNYFSIAQILIFMAIPSGVIFGLLALRSGASPFSRGLFRAPVIARNLVEALSAISMVSALSLAPMSLVISIIQAVPLFATIGAALFLKEKVGLRRWLAVLVGFFAVLLMLRPDTSGISLGAAFAVLGALGLAARDLITRMMPQSVSTLQMATWGTVSIIPAGLLLLPFTGPHDMPPTIGFAIVLCASLVTAAGYYAITAAMRLGDVSSVTPLRYARLIFALLIAMVFFKERPDALTLTGAALVIASGLFVIARERKLSVSGNN